MAQIFFFSPSGFVPMKDDAIHAMCETHGWQADGATWVYGVAVPKPGVDPNSVADLLTSAGVIIIPGKHDPTTPVDNVTQAALAQFGIKANDKGIDVARKMATASGHPHLRPHLY